MTTLLLGLAGTFHIVVAGLGGEPDYEQRFRVQAASLEALARGDGAEVKLLTGESATKSAVLAAIQEAGGKAGADDTVVLTLIGHGTFDGAEYKFNLPGPDVTATEMAGALGRARTQKQLVINLTSASGGSIAALGRKGRVVITATRSGTERNATVFPRYWVEALRDPSADTDKNDAISALEAYRYADKKTAEYYETQKRLATEHALLEDTGEGEGVRAPGPDNGKGQLAQRFALVRLGEQQRKSQTPEKQALLKKKEELEVAIDQLKYRKAALSQAEYQKQLRGLLLELARVQEGIDQ